MKPTQAEYAAADEYLAGHKDYCGHCGNCERLREDLARFAAHRAAPPDNPPTSHPGCPCDACKSARATLDAERKAKPVMP